VSAGGVSAGDAAAQRVRRHVLSVTVRDRPGVLSRIAGLFARRGYNIESLSVAQSETPGLSRTSFVICGEQGTVEQLQKQLQKLIDVVKVTDHTQGASVDRELMLIKVAVRSPEDRVEIRQIAQDFRARIIDVDRNALVFEVTGDEGKSNAFIDQMRDFGILELIRTGRVALTRSGTPRSATDTTPNAPRAA
jgi:acetolactate synthase I/III small subunit